MRDNFWKPQEIAIVKKCHAKGMTAREISAKLNNGRTRNAVIGQMNRLGLYSKNNSKDTAKRTGPKRSPKNHDPASINNKALVDLKKNECHWPISDKAPHYFCGEKAQNGKIYCEYHAALSARKIIHGDDNYEKKITSLSSLQYR